MLTVPFDAHPDVDAHPDEAVAALDPQRDPAEVDVLVVGGGAAGLAAGLQLARQFRSVLVVDAGAPRNELSHEMHGYLGLDGLNPAELLARGRAEVAAYGGAVRAGRVLSAHRVGEVFEAVVAPGAGASTDVEPVKIRARRLLLTAGVVDQLPDVPGLEQRWGRDVIHCPYCHGREVAGQRIAVLATSPAAAHQALLFRQLSHHVTVVSHGAQVPAEERAGLEAHGVRFVEGPVTGLRVDAERDALAGLELVDGSLIEAEAMVVASRPVVALPKLVEGLGLSVQELPGGMGTHVPAGMGGVTDAPGVYVAGNLSEPFAQVGAAAAAGAMAGAVINADLAQEDTAASR